MDKVIVTGSIRSGTTLLANFLNAQDGCTVYRDFLHVQRTRDALNLDRFNTPLSPEEGERVLADHRRRTRNISSDDLPDAVFPNQWTYDTLVDYYTDMLETIAVEGDVLVGHKSTGAEEVLDELLPLVDDLVAIYILRDPRDVCLSARRRWPDQPRGNLFKSCHRWMHSYRQARRVADQDRFAKRIQVLRYRDLVLRTDDTLQVLSDFLDHPIEPVSQLIDIHSPWKGNSSFCDNDPLFDPSGIGRWRQQAPWFGHVVEYLCTPLFQEAGYPGLPGPSVGNWLGAIARDLPDLLHTEARYIRHRFRQWRAART